MDCPLCKKKVDSKASICPYCKSNIVLHGMAYRQPKAFGLGILFSLIGIILSYIIHTSFICDGLKIFKEDPGCCICLTGPILFMIILLLGLYAMGGFLIGYIIGKIYFKNKQ